MALDKKKIEKKAKQILDKFASALAKVEKEHDEDFYVDRDDFERIEGTARKQSDDCYGEDSFKKELLENAPDKDEDFILVEKGDWK
tara:strand:+ start:755 stop:1012 length:258 start_codon:yes stop_codon:yes gene_type:complete